MARRFGFEFASLNEVARQIHGAAALEALLEHAEALLALGYSHQELTAIARTPKGHLTLELLRRHTEHYLQAGLPQHDLARIGAEAMGHGYLFHFAQLRQQHPLLDDGSQKHGAEAPLPERFGKAAFLLRHLAWQTDRDLRGDVRGKPIN